MKQKSLESVLFPLQTLKMVRKATNIFRMQNIKTINNEAGYLRICAPMVSFIALNIHILMGLNM